MLAEALMKEVVAACIAMPQNGCMMAKAWEE